jgi:hypothetical protein
MSSSEEGQVESEQALVCGGHLPEEAPPFGRGASRVPGMFMALEGVSPSANLMGVKAREAQGRHREVASEGQPWGLKEACIKGASRRTETRYEAPRSDE